MMKWIKEFFQGKEIVEQVDLQTAIGEVRMFGSSQVYAIMRVGEIFESGFGPVVTTGGELVRRHLENANNFLTVDGGHIIPVHRIESVVIKIKPKLGTLTYRR